MPLLRGFAGATFATFVALLSHAWVGGGGMPGMLGIVVPWLLSVVVCTLLAGRRLSAMRLSLSVIMSQLLFHTLFVLGSITPAGGITPHVHGAVPMSTAGEAIIVPEDAGMWIAHGIAAVVTIAVLHRGESIVRGLLVVASALSAWLRRALPADVVPVPALAAEQRWAAGIAPTRRDPLRGSVHRRGPPLLLV